MCAFRRAMPKLSCDSGRDPPTGGARHGQVSPGRIDTGVHIWVLQARCLMADGHHPHIHSTLLTIMNFAHRCETDMSAATKGDGNLASLRSKNAKSSKAS